MRRWEKDLPENNYADSKPEEGAEFRTVGELKKWLDQFPDDSHCWAYEGECCGVIVAPPNDPQNHGGYVFYNTW